MSNYSDNLPTYLKADSEDQLQKALRELAIESGRLIRPLSVYVRGSKVVCWFILDMKNIPRANEKNETLKKKKKTKKAN